MSRPLAFVVISTVVAVASVLKIMGRVFFYCFALLVDAARCRHAHPKSSLFQGVVVFVVKIQQINFATSESFLTWGLEPLKMYVFMHATLDHIQVVY